MTTAPKLYKAALTDLYIHNAKERARAAFVDGYTQWPTMCDFYRGEIAARQQPHITLDDLDRIYDTKTTYGELSISTHQPAAYPRFDYTPFDFFNTAVPVTTYPMFTAAYAMCLVDNQRYRKAFSILEEAHSSHPWILAAYCHLYRQTSRWNDLLVSAIRLNKTHWIDPVTQKPMERNGKLVKDKYLRALSVLLAGEAYAHLSNSDLAEQSLDTVATTDHPYLASYANVLKCYLKRQQGKHDEAVKLLKTAQSIAHTYHTDTAENDPTLLLSITTDEKIQSRTDPWDPTTEPVQKFPPNTPPRQLELLTQAENDLASMIGMEDVKNSITTLRREIEYNKARKERGFPVTSVSRHLILSGPPGTGKTSIAHIVAKYYAGYGIVENPEITIATRANLIGKTEGSTAQKTQEMFDQARGGVLFIDEAPDMIQDREEDLDARGQESISTLLQNMENHRDDTIVIFAGYEGGMQRLLNTNEGLRSRFPTWIMFSSYTPETIADIADAIAQSRGNILGTGAKEAIVRRVTDIQADDYAGRSLIDKLGNGRLARNIIEAAETNRVRRLAGVNLEQIDNMSLLTLTEKDVDAATRNLITSAL